MLHVTGGQRYHREPVPWGGVGTPPDAPRFADVFQEKSLLGRSGSTATVTLAADPNPRASDPVSRVRRVGCALSERQASGSGARPSRCWLEQVRVEQDHASTAGHAGWVRDGFKTTRPLLCLLHKRPMAFLFFGSHCDSQTRQGRRWARRESLHADPGLPCSATARSATPARALPPDLEAPRAANGFFLVETLCRGPPGPRSVPCTRPATVSPPGRRAAREATRLRSQLVRTRQCR